MKGTKDASGASAGSNEVSRLVMTDAICGAVYGMKGSKRGFNPRALRRGRKRSVRSSAFAMPIRMRCDAGLSAHSKRLYRSERSSVRRWSISSRMTMLRVLESLRFGKNSNLSVSRSSLRLPLESGQRSVTSLV